jgi:hypothetical protein
MLTKHGLRVVSLLSLPVFSVILFSSSVLGANLTINGSTQTISGDKTYNHVKVINGGTLYTSQGNKLTLNADSIFVDSGSSINADKRGYAGGAGGSNDGGGAGGSGPGGGGNGSDGGQYSGGEGGGSASYGGPGGTGTHRGTTGPVYGSHTSKRIRLGSGAGGGGADGNKEAPDGEPGGGAVVLNADLVDVDGTITADGGAGGGGSGDGGYYDPAGGGGGGSGGGILISGGNVELSGSISADAGPGGAAGGGSTGEYSGTDGGGGRIKVFYCGISDSASYSVSGNNTGTIYKTQDCADYSTVSNMEAPAGSLWIEGSGFHWADGSMEYYLDAHTPSELVIDGTTKTLNETSRKFSKVVVKNGGTLNINGKVEIRALNFTVEAGSTVNGNYSGYSGGTERGSRDDGEGPGGGTGCYNYREAGYGGGYGGLGGNGTCRNGGESLTYGSASSQEIEKGSGGGASTGGKDGGDGGAGIKIWAEKLNVHGTVTVDGGKGESAYGTDTSAGGGGGSGGGIMLKGNNIDFTGTPSADGGGGGVADHYSGGGGGGGGRIKVFYENSFHNTGVMSVVGGNTSTNSNDGDPGKDGTIHTNSIPVPSPPPGIVKKINGPPGSIWIEGGAFRWIGQSGFERSYKGPTVPAGYMQRSVYFEGFEDGDAYRWDLTYSDSDSGVTDSPVCSGDTSANCPDPIGTYLLQADGADNHTSPAIDLSDYSNVTLNFALASESMDDSTEKTIIEVSDDGGTSWNTVKSVSNVPTTGTKPPEFSIDISHYATSNLKLRINNIGSNGGGDHGFLDQINITVPEKIPSQPATASPGNIWMENSALHYIDQSGNKRTIS